jgi:hypothetical protein
MTNFVPTFVPAVIAARQRRVLRKFQVAGAVGPTEARTPAEVNAADDRFLRHLVRAGVLASPEPGRYFVSAAGLARWQRRRLVAVCVVIVILAVGAALAVLTGAL